MFPMTDKEILQALRKGDEAVTREYFYGWCRMAYRLCDERYELCFKEGMDFYSLAHDFYLRMAFDDWQAAEAGASSAVNGNLVGVVGNALPVTAFVIFSSPNRSLLFVNSAVIPFSII